MSGYILKKHDGNLDGETFRTTRTECWRAARELYDCSNADLRRHGHSVVKRTFEESLPDIEDGVVEVFDTPTAV